MGKQGMTTRQRFRALMNFEPFDRLPVVEWAPWWDKTLERWYGEGLPRTLTDRYDICEHLGLDLLKYEHLRPIRHTAPRPSSHGAGILATEADYDRLAEHLYPQPALDADRWRAWADQQRRGEVALWYNIDGFFWFPRTLLGIERHLYAFYDQPRLVQRMNADLAAYHLEVFEEICRICVPDFVCFAEDMCYNHGPMLSKECFDEFLAPYYRHVVPRIRDRGAICFVDCDGDITRMIPWLKEVGIEGALPLERQAGVDVAALRRAHPQFRFIGCYDKMVMNRGEEAMRAEFQRLLPVARRGGLVVSCDHQTPPGVSYQDYQLYLKLFREYAAMV